MGLPGMERWEKDGWWKTTYGRGWKRVEVGTKRMGWGMSELGRGEGADAVGNIWPRLARLVINFRS